MGLFSDRDINEVERILLMYLDSKYIKNMKLGKKRLSQIQGTFLVGFHYQWEFQKTRPIFNPPPWMGRGETLQKGLAFYLPILNSPSGAIDKPEHFGICLSWIVGSFKYIPRQALQYPE